MKDGIADYLRGNIRLGIDHIGMFVVYFPGSEDGGRYFGFFDASVRPMTCSRVESSHGVIVVLKLAATQIAT